MTWPIAVIAILVLMALCGVLQLRYGTHRAKRRAKNLADPGQPMLGDFDKPNYPKGL